MIIVYEFHGWVVLRYHSHDSNEKLQNEAFAKFLDYIEVIDSENTTCVKRRNGIDSFLISGVHNHKVSYVLDIFIWISKHLPGSYGLLYIHDDEDFDREYDNSNKFIVWRLIKGRLLLEEDHYLSPYIPTVEDEFDPTRND
jgi:hypothetical protein